MLKTKRMLRNVPRVGEEFVLRSRGIRGRFKLIQLPRVRHTLSVERRLQKKKGQGHLAPVGWGDVFKARYPLPDEGCPIAFGQCMTGTPGNMGLVNVLFKSGNRWQRGYANPRESSLDGWRWLVMCEE